MSADEETARHVPVRKSETAAALTGGGGSMSRRRRDGEQNARWRARLLTSGVSISNFRLDEFRTLYDRTHGARRHSLRPSKARSVTPVSCAQQAPQRPVAHLVDYAAVVLLQVAGLTPRGAAPLRKPRAHLARPA